MTYPGWKYALFALLALNTGYFAIFGTPSKAIDAGAWLVLLVLFEVETRLRARGVAAGSALRVARLIAAAGVVAATIGYLFEDNLLDAINTVLWLGVIALLEIELRKPALVKRFRAGFLGVATVVYGGLALLVAMWAWRGEWFDAYDALVWLAAFATIELEAVEASSAKPVRDACSSG